MGDNDMSNPQSNSSGLDFINSRSNPVDPVTRESAFAFATQSLLSSATRGRYWKCDVLTLWQGFALYCHLDPDVLGPPSATRMAYLAQVVPLVPAMHNLCVFWHNLELIGPARSSTLPVLQQKDAWFESTTAVEPLRAYLQANAFHVEHPKGYLYHLLIDEEFSRLLVAVEAYLKFYANPECDADALPRNEAVRQFARTRGGSPALWQTIARVTRPPEAPKGRPRRQGG